MICNICNHQSKEIFQEIIFNKYNVKYFYCEHCGFLQTEDPYWLNEAYDESINISDTGYLQRNLILSKKLTVLLGMFFNKNLKFLDYAGGYGILVRIMRDIGFDFYWDDMYTENIFARGFEYKKQSIDVVTTFESFEHFSNPIKEIEKLLSISKTIIFSTELLPDPTPKGKDWWYYGLEHGQHISFYSEKTFKFIASKYGINYFNLGPLQILTSEDIPVYMKFILKLTRLGIHNVFIKQQKSKTWSDHNEMSKGI